MRPRDPDEGVDTLDVLAWNPHVGNSAGRVLGFLDNQAAKARPDVIVLNEVSRHRPELAQWAKTNGYRHYQEHPLPEDPNKPKPVHGTTALLVTTRRKDLLIGSHRVVAMKLTWTVFSHNRVRAPRRYERVRFRTRGGWWKFTGSHWPTNGFDGGNRRAFAESAVRAAAALRVKKPGVVGVDVGDHNESVRRLTKWAQVFGGRVAGHGPDSAVVTGATVEATVLAKRGSDHHPIRYRITRSV